MGNVPLGLNCAIKLIAHFMTGSPGLICALKLQLKPVVDRPTEIKKTQEEQMDWLKSVDYSEVPFLQAFTFPTLFSFSSL